MSSAGASFKHIYHLGMFNVESEVGKAVVLSTAVHFDRDFKEFSALRLGPAKGQRRYEITYLYRIFAEKPLLESIPAVGAANLN
jgi:hypothetical protein